MIYFFKELDEMGKKLGYPFYVFRDGKCSKSAVSLDGKDIYIMEINEPFESCEILSFDKEIKNDDFCFWNIEGKSVDELLHRRDDIQPWHGVFLTQNEKKELFENGNGEALKLILDKFSLSDCFSEILFKRGLESAVLYYLNKRGYSQNLENSITKYGSVQLIYMILPEARFSNEALITLIKRGLDGIVLFYLRKKEDRINTYHIGLESEAECLFVKRAQACLLSLYIKRYGLKDSSVEALIERDETDLIICYLKKLDEIFPSCVSLKLDSLNKQELNDLYKKVFS